MRSLKFDFVAGLTFAIVSVPQAMAHAVLATVNPVLGIYTLVVAVPVAAIFTSSVFMNVSTTAATLIVAGEEACRISPGEQSTGPGIAGGSRWPVSNCGRTYAHGICPAFRFQCRHDRFPEWCRRASSFSVSWAHLPDTEAHSLITWPARWI